MIDPKEFDFVCQNAHMLFGAIVVIVWGYFFGPHDVLWAALAFSVYAAGKEFWYDMKYETPADSGGIAGSLKDFCYYNIGGVAGLSIVGLRTVI